MLRLAKPPLTLSLKLVLQPPKMLLALVFAACCMLNNAAAAKTTAAVALNNGVEMPLVGCGLAGKLGVPSIKEAIKAGFR